MHCASAVFISVNYNADEETREHLASLRQLEHQHCLSFFVVDNTERKAGDSLQIPESENVSIVKSPRNLGYLGGACYGLSQYLGNHLLPDWVIVSNVDLLIRDSQFLIRLAELRAGPHVGVVAPSIRSALTGKDQNPFMRSRPSVARMHAYKWMYQSWLVLNTYELASAGFHNLRSTARKLTWDPFGQERNSGGKIYAPHGSFLIFSSQYFRAGGNLDFPCFLFGEEIYLAESLRMVGLDVVYEPSLEVVHQEHKSTKLVKSRKLARAVASSAAYCADTYFPLK